MSNDYSSEKADFENWLKENNAPVGNDFFNDIVKRAMFEAWLGAKESYNPFANIEFMKVETIVKAALAQKEDRAKYLPSEQDAMRAIQIGISRLEDIGWSRAIYCPKDGSVFLGYEAGSSSAVRCNYYGDWPKGTWLCYEGGDAWPFHPTMYRLETPKSEMGDAA